MNASVLHEIVTALIFYIQAEAGLFGAAIPVPEVKFLPQQELAARACNGRCNNVHGWFSYEDGVVYMALDTDVRWNLHDRSILLHELVHHVQHHRDSPRLHNDCATWKARELEAYDVQHRWLYHKRVPVRTRAYNSLLAGFSNINCDGYAEHAGDDHDHALSASGAGE